MPIQHQVFPTYRIRTARQTPLSPSSTIPTLYPSHPTPLPSQLYSNKLDPTLDHIKNAPYTIPQTDTPYPSQPVPLPHLNPTQLPHHTNPIYYRTLQTLTSPTQYAHPAAKTLISPSKAHMTLGRFCCALIIEYKCKTSHINKCL